jgi:hypothetical protein
MSDYAEWARFRLTWIAWSVREFFRDLWDGIPGPWPVKVLAMLVLLACLGIPGPFDEMAVILLLRYAARRRAGRRAAEHVCTLGPYGWCHEVPMSYLSLDEV